MIEQLEKAGAVLVKRLSQRRVIYQYPDGTQVIYNRNLKALESVVEAEGGFHPGDSVQWSLNNSRTYNGVILEKVEPGVRVDRLTMRRKYRQYNTRPLRNLVPRGQAGFLVIVCEERGDTLYFPSVSKLRKT